MSWERLPPLTQTEAGFRSGCLNCGPQPVMIPLDAHSAHRAAQERGDIELAADFNNAQ